MGFGSPQQSRHVGDSFYKEGFVHILTVSYKPGVVILRAKWRKVLRASLQLIELHLNFLFFTICLLPHTNVHGIFKPSNCQVSFLQKISLSLLGKKIQLPYCPESKSSSESLPRNAPRGPSSPASALPTPSDSQGSPESTWLPTAPP